MPSSRPFGKPSEVPPSPRDEAAADEEGGAPIPRFVVVTGASGAIGSALVRRFRAAGYRTCGIDKAAPRSTQPDLFLPVDLAAFVNDGTLREEVLRSILDWLDGHGLRALINNAAYQHVSRSHPLEVARLQMSYDVNVIAPYLLVAHLAEKLEQGRGSVVNLSSIHARLSKPGFVAYAATKAALSALTRGLALDFGRRFRINCIEPASVATQMLLDGFADAPQGLRELEDFHPQGRIATAEEIAEMAFQINSNELRFLHGACIDMSGGIGARLHDPC